jgi:hypothetical protein
VAFSLWVNSQLLHQLLMRVGVIAAVGSSHHRQ